MSCGKQTESDKRYFLSLFSWCHCLHSQCHLMQVYAGLPQSGKNIWKMKFFPGQGKVREFCGWSGKFRKDLESQGI